MGIHDTHTQEVVSHVHNHSRMVKQECLEGRESHMHKHFVATIINLLKKTHISVSYFILSFTIFGATTRYLKRFIQHGNTE